MPFYQTLAPAAEPVSLAEAKSHLRITHADDDAYIDKLIIAARRAVEDRSGLKCVTQNWSLFLDCWPDDGVISLGMSPVSAVTDVKLYGEDDTPSTVDPAHYFLDVASEPARLALRYGRARPQPGRRLNGVEVRMVVGFGAAAAVPQDLKQAILLTVAHWFDRRGEKEGGSLPLSALELISVRRVRRLA
jgi:uncharacterized phiE125 gp8 family phage protein